VKRVTAKGEKALTPRQEAFCLAYMTNGGNASKAYRECYRAAGMADKTIWEHASRLLARGKVRARVAELREAAAAAAVVSAAEVLRETAHIAFSDPLGVVTAEGHLRRLSDMTPSVRAAVATIEFEEAKVEKDGEIKRTTRVKRVKFWDKNSGLEKLMKHLGMFERDNVQRRNLFDGLPAAEAKRVMDRIRELENRRPGVAGDHQPSDQKDPIH
jgi:phage terminase small subunit